MMEIAGYGASILIGLSLGLLGGGGSILTIPILVYLFLLDPVIATTYSLFVVGITSAAGSIIHYQKGNVSVKVALLFGIPSLFAVYLMRRWVMGSIPDHLFYAGTFDFTKSLLVMLSFAVLMIAASVSMIRQRQQKPIPENGQGINYVRLFSLSILVGIITGFVGVGGGFLIIPSLVILAGLPMKEAVGTSLLIMSISSLLGVLGDVSAHAAIDYLFLAKFSGFAVAGIFIGTYLSNFIVETKLKPVFGWFVLVMGTIILVNSLWRL